MNCSFPIVVIPIFDIYPIITVTQLHHALLLLINLDTLETKITVVIIR